MEERVLATESNQRLFHLESGGSMKHGWEQATGEVIAVSFAPCYPHIPIGKVWIYRLLFVCVFCLFVCMVKDFSAENKASGVKFWTAVYRHPVQGISGFCELCSPSSPKSASARATHTVATREVGSACVDIGQSPLCTCLAGSTFSP